MRTKNTRKENITDFKIALSNVQFQHQGEVTGNKPLVLWYLTHDTKYHNGSNTLNKLILIYIEYGTISQPYQTLPTSHQSVIRRSSPPSPFRSDLKPPRSQSLNQRSVDKRWYDQCYHYAQTSIYIHPISCSSRVCVCVCVLGRG